MNTFHHLWDSAASFYRTWCYDWYFVSFSVEFRFKKCSFFISFKKCSFACEWVLLLRKGLCFWFWKLWSALFTLVVFFFLGDVTMWNLEFCFFMKLCFCTWRINYNYPITLLIYDLVLRLFFFFFILNLNKFWHLREVTSASWGSIF